MEIKSGSCHCGKVKFQAQGDFKNVISCNCSICLKKGTLLAFLPESNFKLEGSEYLKDYQFGKKRLHHQFCSVCGISVFGSGVAPKGEKTIAINVRCFDDVDLKDFNITEYDGKSL